MYLALLSPLTDIFFKFFFFFKSSKKLLIYFWLFWVFVAVCGLSLVGVSRRWGVAGVAVFVVFRLLIVVVSLLVEHGLFLGLVVLLYRLSYSRAYGIFLDQGLNLCPLELTGGFFYFLFF